jgi:acetate kinase
MNAKEIETLLYQESGLLGISGISNDMRDLLRAMRSRHASPSTISCIGPQRKSAH